MFAIIFKLLYLSNSLIFKKISLFFFLFFKRNSDLFYSNFFYLVTLKNII